MAVYVVQVKAVEENLTIGEIVKRPSSRIRVLCPNL